MIRNLRLFRVITVKERSLRREAVKEKKERFFEGGVMEREGRQFETNDLGLVVFGIVAGWLILFQSGLF